MRPMTRRSLPGRERSEPPGFADDGQTKSTVRDDMKLPEEATLVFDLSNSPYQTGGWKGERQAYEKQLKPHPG